jgi:porphobilinogen synthase
MSYAIKYASAFYGPFREAAEGAPQQGDRRGYQMDPANGDEALWVAEQAMAEQADMLIVKPGALYGDVIYRVTQAFPGWPIGAYHVSGEYAAIKVLAKAGLIDEKQAVFEVHEGLKRAGASFIISYYSKELVQWLAK